MKYEFVCDNPKCGEYGIPVTLEMHMSEVGTPQYCPHCKEQLRRVYSSFGLKTNDGYKK
jgi:hypothetical protein